MTHHLIIHPVIQLALGVCTFGVIRDFLASSLSMCQLSTVAHPSASAYLHYQVELSDLESLILTLTFPRFAFHDLRFTIM